MPSGLLIGPIAFKCVNAAPAIRVAVCFPRWLDVGTDFPGFYLIPQDPTLLFSHHINITRTIQSAVTGRAPVTLEWKNTAGENKT